MRANVEGVWVDVPLSGEVTGGQLAGIIGGYPTEHGFRGAFVQTVDMDGNTALRRDTLPTVLLAIDEPSHGVYSIDLFDEAALERLRFVLLPKPVEFDRYRLPGPPPPLSAELVAAGVKRWVPPEDIDAQ